MTSLSNRVKKFLQRPKRNVITTIPISELHNRDGTALIYNPYSTTKKSSGEPNYKSRFNWLWSPRKGVRWDFDPILCRNLAQSDPWVQMLVASICKEVANTPWQIVENDNTETQKNMNPFQRYKTKIKKASGGNVEDAETLLKRPNPDHSFTDLITMWMADLLEVGSLVSPKAFSEDDYDNDEKLISDEPTLIYIQPSDPVTWTKSYHGKTGVTEGYWQYSLHGTNSSNMRGNLEYEKPLFFKTVEVVWSDINPRSNRRYGLPPVQSVRSILELLDLSIEQEQRYWSRGAMPNGALVTNGDIEEIKALKQQITEVKGHPEKMLHISDPDAKFIPFSFNWKELDMTSREQWYSKVIASAFSVPVSVVGLKPEDVNRATFQGERDNFESNTLGPYLQKIERVINNQIVWPHFGEEIRFTFTPGLSEQQKKMISDRVSAEFNNNIIKRNEARRQLGYEELGEDGFRIDVAGDDEDSPFMEMMSNQKKTRKNDEPLRETDNWQQFSFQPSDVKNLKKKITPKIKQLFDIILNDKQITEKIDEMVVEKSSTLSISTLIMEGMKDIALVKGLKKVIEETTSKVSVDVLLDAVADTNMSIDTDSVLNRIKNRPMQFVDDYAKRMEETVRDIIADGWKKGESIDEIKDNIREKGEEFSDYQAERIARTELQRSTSQARNEFAKENNLAVVWLTSNDNRVRPGHKAMHNKWKYPHEKWPVPYKSAGGTVLEETIGDSEYGVNCRCTALLEDPRNLKQKNHVGV